MSLRAASPAVFSLLLLAAGSLSGRAAWAEERDLVGAIDKIEHDITISRGRLSVVRDLVERGEVSSLERAKQRFNEAETQFLLENYDGCAALLTEALDAGGFKSEPVYPSALYYLGESLYQIQSFLEARRYFREAIGLLKPGRMQQDTIVRLMDLSDRTGDFSGIDQYYESAQKAGNVRSEVIYLHAKWTAGRKDLPFAERAQKADADFQRLQPGQAYFPQALFFRGAIQVQLGHLDQSVPLFEQLSKLENPKNDAKIKRVKDLANLALARVYYEQGKHELAVDRYQEVPRDSADYNDAMFETAATFVKMGNYEQALRTSDILLIIGKDSPVAPEAKVLQANLQLKLGKYEKAMETFNDVVQSYGPVRDQVQALISRPNPVEFFDSLLQQKGALDIESLLPPQARSYVKTNDEIQRARSIANDLGVGKKAIEESNKLAQELLERLNTGRLDIFPQLQEGNGTAVTLSNQLASMESSLMRLQVRLLGDELPADVRERLTQLEEERSRLDQQFAQLPKTREEFDKRQAAFNTRIASLERLSFDLQKQMDYLLANLNGLEKYWRDTKGERQLSAEQEQEQLSTFAQYRTLLDQLDTQRKEIVAHIQTEKASAGAQAAGGDLEEQLRQRYHQQLTEMQQLILKALPQVRQENKPLLARIGQARIEIENQQNELAQLRARLRQKAQERIAEYKRRVASEQLTLEAYNRQVGKVEGDTRHLLGEIAYNSFSRVSKQFKDIVIKADVGIIDVAWTRKKDRSDRIAALARDKEEQIKKLQDQYKEVLGNGD